MQYETQQLKRQQLIMQCLGFYNGKIDGIWGPKSIDAKKRFESSPKYLPALPANGMPFAARAPFPNGVTLGRDGLLYHEAIEGVLDKEKQSAKKPTALPVVAEKVEAAPVAKPDATVK